LKVVQTGRIKKLEELSKVVGHVKTKLWEHEVLKGLHIDEMELYVEHSGESVHITSRKRKFTRRRSEYNRHFKLLKLTVLAIICIKISIFLFMIY
jgi:hypothetical protein